MIEKKFIDTNIWFYAFVRGKEPAESVKTDYAEQCIHTTKAIVVSSQIINEVCVNLIKKAAFEEERIAGVIAAFYQSYEVMPIVHPTLLLASDLRKRYRLSYWDSLMVASALEANCAVLYTEDLQHGQVIDTTLTIMNPLRLA